MAITNMKDADWLQMQPFFTRREFLCKETNEDGIQLEFMKKLYELRKAAGFSFYITSGYRSVRHSLEARKAAPGPHTTGRACDVACLLAQAYKLVQLAPQFGMTGIGVQQKGAGASRFIHLDDLPASETFPRPTIWSY